MRLRHHRPNPQLSFFPKIGKVSGSLVGSLLRKRNWLGNFLVKPHLGRTEWGSVGSGAAIFWCRGASRWEGSTLWS